MRRNAAGRGAALAALTLGAGVASACPFCDSERAAVVREGIREEADAGAVLGLLGPGAAAVSLSAWLWLSSGARPRVPRGDGRDERPLRAGSGA